MSIFGIDNFSASSGLTGRFKGDTKLLTQLCQVRTGVMIQKLQKTGKITDHCKILQVMTSVM
jgi:hypothetical protein